MNAMCCFLAIQLNCNPHPYSYQMFLRAALFNCAVPNVTEVIQSTCILLLLLCLTLCDPIDSSPPGSPVPGILQARTLEWVAVGGQREALCPWQRSWGRRLDIRKGGIEPQESPWKSSSVYPHSQSLPTLLLCALTYTSDFTGGCPPLPLSEKELT